MIEQMKPSGIDWIGDVPQSWIVSKVKYNTIIPLTDGPHETPVFVDEGIPFYSVDGIRDDKIVYEPCRYISTEDANRFDIKVKPQRGDILMGKAASVGKIAIIDKDVRLQVWSPLAVIRVDEKRMNNRFLRYYLLSSAAQVEIDLKSTSNTQKNIAMEDIENITILKPEVKEQLVIADYLDSQCSKLDSIIADLEKQIDTLQKYKKSLITETVTKGLDKSAQMKDSGIEWIGQIADKFTVKRLKYMVEIKDGTHDTPDYVEESDTTYPLITSKYIDYDTQTIDFESAKHISKIDFENIYKRSNVEFGDIIMPMIGTIGNPVIVNTEEPFAIKNVALFKTSKNLTNAKYIFYQFYSYMLSEQFNIMARGGVQSFVSLEVLGNLLFVDCSQKEKEAIVNFLDQQCSALDKIIMEKQKELNLLNKHKKSLIYEYVTGKKRVTEVK